MFPNKNWSLGGLKALIEKKKKQVLLLDVLGSGRKYFMQSLCSIFLIFSQRFDQVIIFSANSHHDIGIN